MCTDVVVAGVCVYLSTMVPEFWVFITYYVRTFTHCKQCVCVCVRTGEKTAPVLPPSKPPQTADASDWARRNDCCARLAGLLLLLVCSLPVATHLAGLCVRMFVYDFLCAFAALLQHKRRKDARTHARTQACTHVIVRNKIYIILI